jgi:hypothetical protein
MTYSVRPSSLPAAALARQWGASHWSEASLYCVLARSFHCEPAASGGLSARLGSQALQRSLLSTRAWRVRTVSDTIEAYLSERLNEHLDEARRRVGCDLVDDERHQVLSHELRYCPACLRQGYHATLFQHWGLPRCPRHHDPLAVGCPRCRQPLIPTLRGVSSDPFACGKCGHLFISSLAAAEDARSLKALDEELGARRPGLIRPSGHAVQRSRLPDNLHYEGSHASKIARRFAVWSQASVWGSFREEAIAQTLEGERPAGEAVGVSAATRALDFLVEACSAHGDYIESISRRLAVSGPGVRLDGQASAVAVALCKTAFIYRLHKVIAWRFGSYPEPHLRDDVWELACFGERPRVPNENFSRIQELEILGLFALSLIEAANARRLSDIAWSQHPPRCRFVPAWCRLRGADGVVTMRIRARAFEPTIARLISRYATRTLLSDEAT